MLIGEPYWRREPPTRTLEGCHATSKDEWLPLPVLIGSFGELGCVIVEMVLADQDSWDRYAAPQWLNIRRWLDANPRDELAGEMRAELTAPHLPPQGMARVRSGQAPAWPLVSDRSVRRGSRVKRDFACTFTRHLSHVLVALRPQSRLRLEGRARTLSGPSPAPSPARALALRRREGLLIRSPPEPGH